MICVAMILAFSAAFGIWKYLNQTQEVVKNIHTTRPVVFSNREIAAGEKLASEDLIIKQLPIVTTPQDYPDSIEALAGRSVKSTILQDEVVTEIKLVAKGAINGLSDLIPEGKRAISIKTNEIVGVGGFVKPGDSVDILSVFKSNSSEEGESKAYSKTLFQNVLVIAVEDKMYDPNLISEIPSMIASYITIALTPEESEKLALAMLKSQLQLSLRPHGDKKTIELPGTSTEEFYSYLTRENLASVSTGIKADINSIEVILGNKKSYVYY